jgi:formate/nitrite transporter FocA (FNT family)
MARSQEQRRKQPPSGDTGKEAERIEERTTPPTPVIYEVVRRLGKEEMTRPAVSLWWSGLAGGLSISFCLVAQGILRMHLPDAPWRHLLVALGYPVGFLMVVLSRQQLFTETTITVMLPLIKEPTLEHFAGAARMWSLVLVANLVGTLAAALFFAFAPAIDAELRAAMLETARGAMAHGWFEMMFRAVIAGFLMATLVWLIPSAGHTQFHIVTVITFVIGAGDFSHIVAGSTEAFFAAANGAMTMPEVLGRFLAPVLVGNIVGGTALFAVLSYAQVMKEI